MIIFYTTSHKFYTITNTQTQTMYTSCSKQDVHIFTKYHPHTHTSTYMVDVRQLTILFVLLHINYDNIF